jgi:hypothetical protein
VYARGVGLDVGHRQQSALHASPTQLSSRSDTNSLGSQGGDYCTVATHRHAVRG